MAAVMADRAIRAEAHTDADRWYAWLDEIAVPRPVPAGLLDASRRLVVVSPHPDDEVLGCGGLIAGNVERGSDVLVVAVTDGEASHPGEGWAPTRLAATRHAERCEGLAQLGVPPSAVVRLGLPDTRVRVKQDALLHRLRGLLTPGDRVVTTWRHDGHADHDAVGEAVVGAVDDVGARLFEAPVWMWQWSTPGDPRVPWDRLRCLPLAPETCARKARALAKHRTQLTPRVDGSAVLGAAIRARAAWPAEFYLV